MANIVGPIPEPEDLHGREEVLANVSELLKDHNLLLLAPRRFGKSGVMRYLLRHPPHNFLPLSFDLEDVTTGPEFVKRIIEKSGERKELRPLLKKCGGMVSDFIDAFSNKVERFDVGAGLPGITLRKSIKDDNWEHVAKRVILSLEQAEQSILFLFDEMPEMLRKIAKSEGDDSVRRFLAWFRTVRLDERDDLRKHRFVVAGSTGLNYLLDKRLGCPDALNDFKRITVEPLEMPEAVKLCQLLAGGYDLEVSEDTIERMLVLIGQPVPYFIQLFFSNIGQNKTSGMTALTVDFIDQIYKERLMGRLCKRYFDQYRRRLEKYFPEQETIVINILVAVAISENGLISSQLYNIYQEVRGDKADSIEFCELLADLECDWYLELNDDDESYSFYMSIMGDWWKRWYRHVYEI